MILVEQTLKSRNRNHSGFIVYLHLCEEDKLNFCGFGKT